jgi:hypothetical protein
MRKLKGSGSSYLKNQTRKNLAKAILSMAFFIIFFALASYRLLLILNLDILEIAGFIFSSVPLAAFLFYQRRYNIYKGGSQGEKNVISTLNRTLNDNYSIINEVYMKGNGGDIDHVVLGPNGVFVLETKNWSGRIMIDGDQWNRPGKKVLGSPSLQAKRNTQKIQRLLDASGSLSGLGVWVEGLVVLTNPHAHISISNPTVPILKVQQLSSYIAGRTGKHLSQAQVQQIAQRIQNA